MVRPDLQLVHVEIDAKGRRNHAGQVVPVAVIGFTGSGVGFMAPSPILTLTLDQYILTMDPVTYQKS